jgi:hypothetical protein
MHKQAVLQVLALELMRRNLRTFNIETAGAIIQEILLSVRGEDADSRSFLKQIENVSGLIVERELAAYEFAHMSFQEYLAAVQIRDTNQEDTLIDNVNNEWWAETIRLYAAQTDATNLMRAAINSSTIAALTLAYDCLEEGARVLPEVRKELGDSLEAGLESKDAKIRRLAAEVKLSRRLNRLLRIAENLEIDTSNISCSEYQLFIDEKLLIGQYHQPDHWKSHRFSEGHASSPITGVRSSDAEEFCLWLTDKYSAPGCKFRIPNLSEIEKRPMTEQAGIGYWCKHGIRKRIEGVSLEQLQAWREPIIYVLVHTVTNSISYSDGREHVLQLADRIANGVDLAAINEIARDLFAIQIHNIPYDINRTITLVKRDLVRAIEITQKLVNSSIARDFAIAPDIALDIGIDLDRVRSLLDFDLDFDLNLYRGTNDELDHDIYLTSILTDRLSLARNFAIEISNDLASATELADDLKYKIFSTFDSHLYHALDRSFEDDRNFASQPIRFCMLLNSILWNVISKNIEVNAPIQASSSSLPSTLKSSYATKRDNALYAYMMLVLISMRQEGRLPSWESIRIVRETHQ